jgi:hypothetical protein
MAITTSSSSRVKARDSNVFPGHKRSPRAQAREKLQGTKKENRLTPALPAKPISQD